MSTIQDYMRFNCEGNFENVIVFDGKDGVEDDIFVGDYQDLPYVVEQEEVYGWELQVKDGEAYICFNIDTSK